MKSKTIAFVTPVYTDNEFDSGGIKLNFILLDGLKKHGYIIDLYTNNIKSNIKNIPQNIFSLKDFETNKHKYDLIISDKAFVPSNITYIHDHSYPYRIKMMSNKLAHFLYKAFRPKHHKRRLNEFLKTKENISSCQKVIVSSIVLKNDMIENYKIASQNIEILPPPIERYQINKIRNSIFTFGISALGFNRKGGYIALNAIRELKKTNKKFKVKFIYPSNNLAVKLLIKIYGIQKYCEFIPQQTDMQQFYNSIDCLIMPSLIEPFGMVATEALSLGCPVITAEHCGASDYVNNGINGFLYKTNSSFELAKAMQQILNTNEKDLDFLKDKSIESVKELYSDDFIRKFLSIIDTF